MRRHLSNRRISVTLRGEVSLLLIYIQSEPIDISGAVGYAYNWYSSLTLTRKPLSKTLITSMSTKIIHQILVKTSTKPVSFC